MANGVKVPEYLVLALCDALQTTLQASPMGVLVGSSEKSLVIGGLFKKTVTWTVRVDQMDDSMVSAYVRIAGDLWAYVVVKDAPKSQQRLWLYFIDGAKAGLTVAGLPDQCKGDARAAVGAFTPFIVGDTLEFDPATMSWRVLPPKPVPVAA